MDTWQTRLGSMVGSSRNLFGGTSNNNRNKNNTSRSPTNGLVPRFPRPDYEAQQPEPFSFLKGPPLTVCGTFGRVCHVFAKGGLTCLGINLLVSLIALLVILLTVAIAAAIAVPTQSLWEATFSQNEQIAFFVTPGLVVELLILFFFQSIADAAILRAVAEIYAQPDILPNVGNCFKAAWQRASTLMGAVAFVGVAFIVFPLCMLAWTVLDNGKNYPVFAMGIVIIGITLFVAFLTFLMYPAIMIESMDMFAGVGRSFELVSKNMSYVFKTLLLWFTMEIAINILVTSLIWLWRDYRQENHYYTDDEYDNDLHTFTRIQIGENFHLDLTFGSIGDGLLPIFVGIILAALGSILRAVIYFNARTKTEELSLILLCHELRISAPRQRAQEEPNAYAIM